MSQIIPPPVKIEFPEQVALSNQISGTRTNVAASEKAVGTVNTKVNELKQTVTTLQQALEARPNILDGTAEPSADVGRDGDVYFVTS